MKEYFSHDYYSREDEKIKKLLYAHNMAGYGLYWCIVEMLYQNEGYCLFECDRIAFDLHSQSDLVESVICDFELFKIEGQKFTSESVLRRLNIRNEKSKKASDSAKQRWDANALRTHCDGNAIKEKKRKEKKKDIHIPEFSEFKKYAIENDPLVDNDSLEKKYKSWIENGWKDGNDKNITNWKSKILNTLPYIKHTVSTTSKMPL